MAAFHVLSGAQGAVADPEVRRIDFNDVFDALRRGLDDFWEKPSHYVFICIVYPIIGLLLLSWASTGQVLQLIFPLIAGFALLGPLAAIGLYEISRRREAGMDTSWRHALEVRRSPAVPSIIAVGLMLTVIFLAWLVTAQAIYAQFYGSAGPDSFVAFVFDVLTTERGWTMLVTGNLIGFLFALVVLATTSVAFPLLLDQDVGASSAIRTSLRVIQTNPAPLLLWGFIVAAMLAVGSLPLFAGLAVVVPILGHATWHLYRKAVVSPTAEARSKKKA
ncbi:DUF2189 domain-containing protein [Oricola cellulosilytica]|uniref:DUF2189 domain-containing protein n=1 Tax=Oricola cellulosilytica TaxID=1429082 RepID=A0A4R0PFR9_9HYPH|nr:DUF2189 domain-containing protein [Oricola cellulosilytica]TCD16686.1 DUF2189 domain-containing protein [Oricola cellulosilytica]